MELKQYSFRTRVWLYDGLAVWYFITVLVKISRQIKINFGALAGGWDTLPVKVIIGVIHWGKPQFFGITSKGAYILPLKVKVRKRENIKANSRVQISLELLV